jgi:DNA repair protein RecO (recombination protein O)
MFRSSSTQAIVLRKTRVSEIHKGLTLLTPQRGLVQALAHGAYKIRSRFRSASEPYSHLKVYLYHDPVKDQYKITDLEALHLFDGIRGDLPKFYTASLWAEVSLKSYGAGEDSSLLYQLLLDALTHLDRGSAEETARISIQFLWRFMHLLGLLPDFESCGWCGNPIEPGEAVFFVPGEATAVCGGCRPEGSLGLSAGAARYLAATLEMPFAQGVRVRLAAESSAALKQASYQLVQGLLETTLNTIRSGAGFL